MPLPSDEKLIALSQDLLKQFDTIFGLYPGFRPAHARGVMLAGTFTPSPDAPSLTRAPTSPATPHRSQRGFPAPQACLRFRIMTPTQIRAVLLSGSISPSTCIRISSAIRPMDSPREQARSSWSSYGLLLRAIRPSHRPRRSRYSWLVIRKRSSSCKRPSPVRPALQGSRTSA